MRCCVRVAAVPRLVVNTTVLVADPTAFAELDQLYAQSSPASRRRA